MTDRTVTTAVVLAAGEGTRLRPRTADRPKPLVEVDGTPILTRCFETLIDLGIREAVVVVGYRHEAIVERYGAAYRDLDVQYAHQAERDGLAHAVLAAEGHVDADFVVVNGDNVYSANLPAALDRHAESTADVTFPVEEVPREEAGGGAVCELDDDGAVTGLVEKPDDPPSTLVPAAFYVLPPEVFPACRIVRPSERGEYELADAIDLLIHAGYRVETVPFEGWKVNVNTEDDIERAERLLAREG
ncbi:sugar phosphate nucleotidyltransferase [Halobaculum sp. EA56]|uniref:sugar phosphate nucleotidyltransferase n=1 Tax=Halobaculum sp. EA56 TaxID=3421648 RepID=UPI003EB9E13B